MTMKNLRYHATKHVTTAALLSAAVTLGLAGCKVGPHYHVPPAMAQAPPVAYKEAPAATDDWKVAQPQDAMLRGKWWEIYNDTDLNTLEDKLNIDNQTIKQYFENYQVARTMIAQARSALYPSIGTTPSYNRTATSANARNTTGSSVGTTTGTGTTTSTSTTSGNTQSQLFSLPLTASWVPDLWGKVRNEVDNARFSAQVSQADLENERLTEQASLATFYFELRGQDALLDLYKQTIDADQKALDLTQASYDLGISDYISVVEAKNTLQNAQAAATNLGVSRAQYQHAIATLIGTSASTFSIEPKPFDAKVPVIPVGLPSQLLERRPDVAAAERTMAAANAEIGVATAAYYPTLTLSAEGGLESSAFSKLFDWSSRFWSVGPSIDETIFDGGLRRATVRQYIATYNADVANYRQIVLTAVQNVEDSLASERILTTQLGQQDVAVKSAQQYVDLEIDRYKAGVDPYVDVTVAQLTLLNDQQAQVTLRTSRMTASVSLIEALGGGWDKSQLASPADVSKKIGKKEIEKTN
jgi:NodT family efflux transporter outer membrane factor (OMF) lipoprotein